MKHKKIEFTQDEILKMQKIDALKIPIDNPDKDTTEYREKGKVRPHRRY